MSKLTGQDAIDYAARTGAQLNKYDDPVEGAREGLTVAEAEDVAAEDPGLVWCEASEERLTVWLPCLRANAPSNTAGMRNAGSVYATREQALAHEHWANQAPYAEAIAVEVSDKALSPLLEYAVLRIKDDADAYGEEMLGADFVRAAELLRAGKYVEGLRLYLTTD